MKNSIKVERAKHNFTQQDLADKINVSRQTIIAIEQGKYIPSTVLALKMATVFGTSVHDFIQLEEEDW